VTGPASADFVVLHHIQDAAGWAAALDTEHNWPDGFDLRSFLEDEAHELAVCVWRAPDRDQLQQSLDATFGHVVVNEVHAVHVHLMRDSEAVDPTN
jgi:hypothetical protein